MIINRTTNFIGCLCYRCDIYHLQKNLLLLQRLFKKAYLSPLERAVPPIRYSEADWLPLGLGSNPGEGMDVCECIVPSWHGGTRDSRRAANPLVMLMEGEDRWELLDH
ncbi:hypothetical protein TNCV_664861 [Trichonephila clavipes]|nr:hypothetical protein TNCV_664861 [Trichonephila clavipes]